MQDKVWQWVRRIGAAIVAVALAALGVGWLWHRRRQLGRVKDELAVARAQQEIARLEGQREEVERQAGKKSEAIEAIDHELLHNKRTIIEAHENGEGLTDEEVLEAFRRVLR